MVTPAASGFDELAQRLDDARLRAFVDLYAARTAEVWWRVADARVLARRELLREGAAVRRDGAFSSADGLDRLVLAELLGVSARTLPAFGLEPFPHPPEVAEVVASFDGIAAELHWRAGWAVLLAAGAAVALRRPQLLEIALPDGQRFLYTWPLPAGWQPPALAPQDGAAVRTGRHVVVLAPAAAAVLFHELLAHPLEGDLLQRGASPFAGRHGERLFALPIDVDDDPLARHLPGSFAIDDEGTGAHRRPLVRGGVLVGMLCDRSSAAALGGAAGNARRAGVHSPPRPRVSNLVVHAAAGDHDGLRSAASIEIGSLAAGTVEPRTGVVSLAVRSAWALRRGRRTHPLAPFALAGTVAAVLTGVETVVGPGEATAEPGWCSKDGEVVPTGAVAPWVLLAGMEAR
jgi:hypothetical protein